MHGEMALNLYGDHSLLGIIQLALEEKIPCIHRNTTIQPSLVLDHPNNDPNKDRSRGAERV